MPKKIKSAEDSILPANTNQIGFRHDTQIYTTRPQVYKHKGGR